MNYMQEKMIRYLHNQNQYQTERKRKSRSELTEDDKINEREKAKKRMRKIRDNKKSHKYKGYMAFNKLFIYFTFMNCFGYCPCWKESFNRSHSIHER